MADYAWKVTLEVSGYLRKQKTAVFPKRIADALGFTRAEVELALWYCEDAAITSSGRWYWSMEA